RRSKNGLADLNAPRSRAVDGGVAGAPANHSPGIDVEQHRRQLLADLCRLLVKRLNRKIDAPPPSPQLAPSRPTTQDPHPLPDLSPRMRQTLDRLLSGDSEKQIAHHMGVSRHT